jgi:signal transduction histidine kinase
MQPLTRQIAAALILLVVFLAAAVLGEAWLQRETRRLRTATVSARRAQLVQAIAITRRAPGTWDDAFQSDLGTLLGGTVTLTGRPDADRPPAPAAEEAAGAARPGNAAGTGSLPAPPAPGLMSFDYAVPGADGLSVHVAFAAPAATRLATAHERMLIAISLLALLLFLASALFALPRRTAASSDTREPWPSARSEMQGLEHFARISVERTEALERESGARLRAEEDLQLHRTLLGQSREERVQLGRELHDNLCQTLYAVSLTLESLRAKLGGGEAAQRLDQCVGELRRLNHKVRSYLRELEPDSAHQEAFAEALEAMLATQTGAGGARLVHKLDPEITALIAPEQAADVVNIIREAISNSLRHGRARTVTVHAGRGEGRVVLAVQDDGAGFDAASGRGQGHGLANMQARAGALGGSVEIISAPGKGTRVLLTLPVASA